MNIRIDLLALNHEEELEKKEQEEIRAGDEWGLTGSLCKCFSACTCGCKYANTGGSTTETNFNKNASEGYYSPGVTYVDADWNECMS